MKKRQPKPKTNILKNIDNKKANIKKPKLEGK